jgi:hypothetical protein
MSRTAPPTSDNDNGRDTRRGPKRADGGVGRERHHAFADESATDSQYGSYGIGALIIPESRLARFNEYFVDRLRQHGVIGEARWKKVAGSHGLINLALELWRDLLKHPSVRFSVIVVRKDLYRKWAQDKEEAFYVTYTFLLRHAANLRPGEFEVVIDDRSDRYGKRDEVLEIVSNHMLRAMKSDSEIVRVRKDDSKLLPGLQAADLLTGAITHAHVLALEPSRSVNPGKTLLLERMAAAAGWSDLYCDTFPDSPMNIWHFPQEDWRGVPETRRVLPVGAVNFVTKEGLETQRRGPDVSAVNR